MLSREIQLEILDYILDIQECGLTHDYCKAMNRTNDFSKLPKKYFYDITIIDKDLQKKQNLQIKYAYVDFLLSRHIHNKTFGANANTHYTMQEQLEYDIRGAIYYIRLLSINGWNEDIYCKFESMILGIKNQLTKIKNYNYKQIEYKRNNYSKEYVKNEEK